VRDKVAKDAVLNLGLSGGETPGLSAIIAKVHSPLNGILKERQSVLVSIINSIEEITRENSIIIGRSLDNINKAFMFLKGLTSPETYTARVPSSVGAAKGTQ
ncbi:MAG: hypothetical protein HY880_05710, partial [Deltaproteobacteria bacterium]|nr:hypothetical protein [Deltaproteobacteria bacterium]